MPNPENLIPNNRRSPTEVRANGSKGGKKAAENRRKRKALKQKMQMLLELPVNDSMSVNALSAMGIDEGEIDNATLMLVKLFMIACEGDVAAVKEIRNIIGDERKTSSEIAETRARTKLLNAQSDRVEQEQGTSEAADVGVVLMPQIVADDNTPEVVVDE